MKRGTVCRRAAKSPFGLTKGGVVADLRRLAKSESKFPIVWDTITAPQWDTITALQKKTPTPKHTEKYKVIGFDPAVEGSDFAGVTVHVPGEKDMQFLAMTTYHRDQLLKAFSLPKAALTPAPSPNFGVSLAARSLLTMRQLKIMETCNVMMSGMVADLLPDDLLPEWLAAQKAPAPVEG